MTWLAFTLGLVIGVLGACLWLMLIALKDDEDPLDSEEADCVEAAKAEIDALRSENSALVEDMNLLRNNNVALRAKIEQMERQEPVAWLHETRRDSDVVTDAVKHVWGKAAVGSMAAYSIPLYALLGALEESK